jgi:glutamate racemase
VLVDRDIKQLVVACNTASTVALDALRKTYASLPVVGVVEPGAAASCRISSQGHIAVIGTESTVNGGAYQRAIKKIRPAARVVARACTLFVALAEEGWVHGPIVEEIARRYLDPLMDVPEEEKPDCLVLGCTHFPVLATAIGIVVGPGVALVDSAATTAIFVREQLSSMNRLRTEDRRQGGTQFLATDGASRFARVGQIFLGQDIPESSVELVDL